MKALKTYTEKEIFDKGKDITGRLKKAGWDDALLYHHEAFVTSYKSALEVLLDQGETTSFEHPIDRNVNSFGTGVSFGGVKLTGNHNLDAVVHYMSSSHNIDQRDISELNKVIKEMIDHGPEKAEVQAKKSRKKLRSTLIPDVYRVFIRVYIPVKYKKN